MVTVVGAVGGAVVGGAVVAAVIVGAVVDVCCWCYR